MWNRIILTMCLVFVLTGLASAGELTYTPDEDFNTLHTAGRVHPYGIWSDGTTMWVVDFGDSIYAFNMKTKAREPDKEFHVLGDTEGVNLTGIWSDGTTVWVTSSFTDHRAEGCCHANIYAYNMRTKAREPDKEFKYNTLRDVECTALGGIWSDGTTMWAVDRSYDRLFAFNMKTKAHDPDKDLALVIAMGKNTFPNGIWSDGTTLWVGDFYDRKIYAYKGVCSVRDQGLWDFAMPIKSARAKILEICVRDHDCEDGDEINVEVNGRAIFSGEIDNEWDCYTLNVEVGETYEIELTALNGTGYKGDDCSHIDTNTGEIRVTGQVTLTQVWRHRGGTGSKARMTVEWPRRMHYEGR